MSKIVAWILLVTLLCCAATLAPAQQQRPTQSHICIYDLDAQRSNCILSTPRHVEAPNWTPDGKHLLVNSGGRLFEVAVSKPALVEIDTGSVNRVNNDHGVSPDGSTLVVSAGHMYTLPRGGGEPKQITAATPSYYHGWSPDGKTLAYCARRNDEYDIYVIPVEGGEETRLTAAAGLDDGPDYSPDGKWIYFNSIRNGDMDIWRIPANAREIADSQAELIVGGPRADWFAHPSPDGRKLVYLSYPEGTEGHPPNRPVQLRMLELRDGKPVSSVPITLEAFTGGQGTINVNSWAPDSRRFAYVRYEYPE